MIRINSGSKIREFSNENSDSVKKEATAENNKTKYSQSTTIRPEVVDAKVYKLKSAFVKNSVFITLSYIQTDSLIRPIEIFINSKDLTRAPEYVVLTRLISAIFRRSTDPMFILEELQGIFDPNGGSFKGGKYYHSFYAEIADVIERFFFDVGILNREQATSPPKTEELKSQENIHTTPSEPINNQEQIDFQKINLNFKICPDCNKKSLKNENGCDSCMECGYSKCDK
tara:strand:- start:876 stop:1559 length:684 start_codon:yes stop_codon:yes gene_type:complete